MTREPDVRRLLDELAAKGRAQEASQFQATFELLGWDSVTDAQVERVRSLIPVPATVPAPPIVAELPLVPPGIPEPSSDESWSPVQSFRPWIESIRFGLPLLEALDRLSVARDFDAVARGLRTLFVDLLGYEAVGLSETSRLSSTGTIRQLVAVARSGDFTVSLAEMVHPRPYASTAQPIFQLHPRGVVVEWYPLRDILRWSTRYVRGATSTIESRTFVGRSLDDSVHDNLITWARRLELLTPRYGDDARALASRAARAIGNSPTALLADWEPPVNSRAGSIASSRLPGVAWEQLGHHGHRSFLQPSGRRWHWGLQRVLRDRFPLQLGRRPRINFIRYDVDRRLRTADDAVSHGLTWADHVTLHFTLELAAGPVELEVPTIVPVIGDGARFVVRGEALRHVARVGRDGAFHVRSAEVDDEELDFEESLLGVEAPAAPELSPTDELVGLKIDDEPESEDDEDEEEDLAIQTDLGLFGGVDPGALLAIAVHRKLGGLVRRWWRDKDRETGDVEWFFAGFASLRDYSGEFCLASAGWLRSVLETARSGDAPVDSLQIIRAQRVTDDDRVPAWACVEVSAELPPGWWYPVAGTRLNPAGGLSVPLADSEATCRLSNTTRDGLELNGRRHGCADAIRPWWIAAPLSRFAHLPADSIERAAHLATSILRNDSGSTPSRSVRTHLVTHGEPRLTLFGPRDKAPVSSTCVRVRLPAATDIETTPVLRVRVGDEVVPGAIWLELDALAWSGGYVKRKKSPSRQLVDDVFRLETGGTSVESWRIPVGTCGTVVEVQLNPIAPRGLVSGWIAAIRVACRRSVGPRWAWLPNGKCVPLDYSGVEDAPFDENGDPVDAVLTGTFAGTPAASAILFDPCSGELIDDAQVTRVPLLSSAPAVEIVGPDPHLAFRLRDGEGIPTARSSPGLSAMERLWWRARDPEGASAMDEVEAANGGGEPPFWGHLRAVILTFGLTSVTPRRSITVTVDLDEEPNDEPEEDFDDDAAPIESTPTEELSGHLVPKTPWTQNKLLNQTMVKPHLLQCSYRYRELAPVAWRCECGTVAGMRKVDEYCPSCKTVVKQRTSELPLELWPTMSLAEPILHPWHADASAALLGLTRAELFTRLAKYRPEPLQERMVAAAANPRIAVQTRLSAEGLPAALARDLRHGAASLEKLLASTNGRVPNLWLQALPILHPALHPCGLPDRAPGVVTSTLRAAYLGVEHASQRLGHFLARESTPLVLLKLAREQVWRAVDRLFGEPRPSASSEEPANLASLAQRLWPLTRAPHLRSSPPGMVAIAAKPASDDDPRAREVQLRTYDLDAPWVEGAVDDWSSALVVPSAETRRGIVRPSGFVWFPPLPVYQGERSGQSFWTERAAMSRLCERWLPHLAATLAVGTRRLAMSGSEQRHTLAVACAALEGPGAAPARLLQLMERGKPATLPPVRDVARARLRRVISMAFPGPDAASVSEALLLALTSWFAADAGDGADLEWTFDIECAEPPSGSVRLLPPWTHTVWETHPEYAELVSPLDRWSLGHPQLPASELARALSGFRTTVVPTPQLSALEKCLSPSPAADLAEVAFSEPPTEDVQIQDEAEEAGVFADLADTDGFDSDVDAKNEGPLGPNQPVEPPPVLDTFQELLPEPLAAAQPPALRSQVSLLNTSLQRWLNGDSK